MLAKKKELIEAIGLRKEGKSYSEISKLISVSQSSLSLWLRNIQLSPDQHIILSRKQYEGQLKGALARKKGREKIEKHIIQKSLIEVEKISKRELWLLGVMAYWCEGSKQKSNNVSQPVVFSNSDPFLSKLFIRWLREICLIKESEIVYSLYIHKNANIKVAQIYWSNVLNISEKLLEKPVLKQHNIKTKRHNIGVGYHGLIRIVVRKSTNLNRQITGWVLGINQNL